jgi:hypothetical protein
MHRTIQDNGIDNFVCGNRIGARLFINFGSPVMTSSRGMLSDSTSSNEIGLHSFIDSEDPSNDGVRLCSFSDSEGVSSNGVGLCSFFDSESSSIAPR